MILFGRGVNVYWLWLPVIWALEIVFVLGLTLAFSALNVFVRDTRYVVESSNTLLFWLVPIFYSFALIPDRFRGLYQFNPVAALVLMLRDILMDGTPPLMSTLTRLGFSSFAMLGLGWLVFEKLKAHFYERL